MHDTRTSYAVDTTGGDRSSAMSRKMSANKSSWNGDFGHLEMGVENAFDFPGFVPAYIRPLFCRGIGPFRWVALSGDPDDILRTDSKVKELMPYDQHLHNWLDMAKSRIPFQGLPARICWVGLGDRHRLGLSFNETVARGELKAPIVIGRDHLDAGSVASPNRETEAMKDGSDAVSDWPLLNVLLNCASGATWVSFHHGGGVGIGFSSTPVWWLCVTARRRRRVGSSASSGTTRRPASCVTPTPVMMMRSPRKGARVETTKLDLKNRLFCKVTGIPQLTQLYPIGT